MGGFIITLIGMIVMLVGALGFFPGYNTAEPDSLWKIICLVGFIISFIGMFIWVGSTAQKVDYRRN